MLYVQVLAFYKKARGRLGQWLYVVLHAAYLCLNLSALVYWGFFFHYNALPLFWSIDTTPRWLQSLTMVQIWCRPRGILWIFNRGSSLQRGVWFVSFTWFFITFSSFFINSPWKWTNFFTKGCSSEPPEHPLDPPLQTYQCIRFNFCGEGSREPEQYAGLLEPSLLAWMRPFSPFESARQEFLAIRRAISLNETFVLFCWNDDWRN